MFFQASGNVKIDAISEANREIFRLSSLEPKVSGDQA